MVASLKLMKNFAIGAHIAHRKDFFRIFFTPTAKKNYESFYSFASTSRRELLVIFMATRASQCENFMIFLSLIFYVKSETVNIESKNLPF